MSSKPFSDSGVQARAFLLPFLPSSRHTCKTSVRGAAWSAYVLTYAEYPARPLGP